MKSGIDEAGTAQPRTAGRREPDPRKRIADAAFALFRDAGYSATSIDRIVARAQVSKRTFYENFASKTDLLEHVIAHFTANAFSAARAISRQATDPREQLRIMVRLMHRAANQPDSVTLMRLQISQARQLGGLPLRLHEHGLGLARDLLRPALSELGFTQPEKVADRLFDFFVVAPLHRRLLGGDARPVDLEDTLDLVLGMPGR